MIKKILKTILRLALILLAIFIVSSFIISPPQAAKIVWGVNFSQKQSENLGLNWKENYSALLDDLGAKNLKLAVPWDLIEPLKNKYDFNDLDWQINEAYKKGVKIILVIGMKTSRWPECHLPQWAAGLPKEEQQKEILDMLGKIITRYRDSSAIEYWQVENEPLFKFGECPWKDNDFLKKEINLVKSLDKRQIIISDTGEWSFWFGPAKLGDLVGVTMYRKVWFTPWNSYVDYNYFLPVAFYWERAQIIKKIFNKKVLCIELQAEPWCQSFLKDCPLKEQEKTMSLEKFKENVDFAKKSGLREFYLWGSEWWYWQKTTQNNPSFWEEAGKLF